MYKAIDKPKARNWKNYLYRDDLKKKKKKKDYVSAIIPARTVWNISGRWSYRILLFPISKYVPEQEDWSAHLCITCLKPKVKLERI